MRAFLTRILLRRWRVYRSPTASSLRRVLVAVSVAASVLGGTHVQADTQNDMTKEEYALLPEICHHKAWVWSQNMNPPGSEKWEAYFGKSDFLPVHHYCWGLVRLARSYRVDRSAKEREWDLREADGGFLYVIQNSSSKTPLLAELWTRRLQVAVLQRNNLAAADAYRAAVQADAKYWRAYWWWAYWLNKNGKTGEAIKVIEEGQRNAPGARGLDKLMLEIRGPGKAKAK
ncbi:MAG TPA: hypothetical protein PKA30_00885 [Accumulibacter sp.]|uniref:hypothetical protein n=1 Tax=Accumulibacter sp. TaxID=2053492 RepID=UPI0026303983|nr:hypothetical protein [Accumulibacter sp.]MDS4056015.1 hypothetical protein [Accumulibacter sp.]HMV04081.1 hypothetical protein [Accumulibacter sp.]HMW78924.1 hypothetical protein [Accumulibacter sp.]HMX68250.1 hypothetical protein [Accumulibacter sp.]HNB67969.1 hypothetical protein [Accumulibacter sp.]